jgi:hypothetical protein
LLDARRGKVVFERAELEATKAEGSVFVKIRKLSQQSRVKVEAESVCKSIFCRNEVQPRRGCKTRPKKYLPEMQGDEKV